MGAWRVGDKLNESTVAELADGRLMLNMRNHDRTKTARSVCFNGDGGLTGEGFCHDATLVEPICQAVSCTDGARMVQADPEP